MTDILHEIAAADLHASLARARRWLIAFILFLTLCASAAVLLVIT